MFGRPNNIARILQGISGRDVRRALEIFVSILISGHLREEAITSTSKGAGEFSIPEYTALKILMRTEYRFFHDDSGFLSNLFYVDEHWKQPNNFLIVDILYWLYTNRKQVGTIGLEGYFSIRHISGALQPCGYIVEDIASGCRWLVRKRLIEADHMNNIDVSADDSVKISASGFIHLRILSERLEYLYGIMSVTMVEDRKAISSIRDYINRENQYDRISPHHMAGCVQVFMDYLKNQYEYLRRSYPQFGGKETGACFVIDQIQRALDYYHNPKKLAR